MSDAESTISDTDSPKSREFRIGYHHALWFPLSEGSDYTKDYVKRAALREDVINRNRDLYHYTSLAGFQGIVDTNGFWASDSRFMNDSTEMTHSIDLVKHVLLHCKARHRSFAKVLDGVFDKFSSLPQTGQLIACFSQTRDSLEQWRGYGPSGAVCIRLTASKPEERPIFDGGQFPYRVLYDTYPKTVVLLSIIRRFLREYNLDRQAMPDHWPDSHDGKYIDYLTLVLSSRAVAFKNNSFKQESEVRLVIPDKELQHYDGGVRFRASPLGLIPYVCTGNRRGLSGKLPIAEVIIGPSPRQGLIAESVRIFLNHRGYVDTQVVNSSVPYRSP